MELLPCPFCGSSNVNHYYEEYFACESGYKDEEVHNISCEDCNCQGPDSSSKEVAVQLWNRRADHQRLVERYQRMVGAMTAVRMEAGSHTVRVGSTTGFAKIYDMAQKALREGA